MYAFVGGGGILRVCRSVCVCEGGGGVHVVCVGDMCVCACEGKEDCAFV